MALRTDWTGCYCTLIKTSACLICISIQVTSVDLSGFGEGFCIVWAEGEANQTNIGVMLRLCPQNALYEYVWLRTVKQCQAVIYSA